MDSDINRAPEAQAFLSRVATLPKEPGASLDPVLAPSIQQESELRRLFAQDRRNSRLANPYVGLISVYEAQEDIGIRSTRARIVKDEDNLSAKHVFPIPDTKRRKDFEPCVVKSLEEFQRNWAIFTEGSLSQLADWNNVIAAGGSVLACLLPLDQANKESRRTIRKFYHSSAYPTSDVDLFLWGLTPEQAEVKINQIYGAVRDSVPWDVTSVRTKHAISIHSQYPYRSVQIVLRLYHSPAEILAGFDVDAPCVAYDGSRILANPRSIVALMRQANTVDVTRRSPSYEVRLAKYASRGFEVQVPDLRRSDVDPTIFERSLNRITGLARLLVLEKLARTEARISYLESRRDLRSRVKNNTIYTRRMRRKRKGDLKAEEEVAGLDMNGYDVASLHVPYGPGWTAKRIEKLVYQTDLGMNSTFNPKNKDRRLHRHVAFFGTMKECVEDLCEYCPEPENDEEKTLQEEEDKQYIRGRISFIQEDPGRQSMTGSFNPTDIGEWSELAYLGPTEKLFVAIAANDRSAVQQLLASGVVDVNRRDHVGRTALQLGALCAATDICADLVDAGARLTPRLADGRTALHLAAQMDMPTLVEKMLMRSTQNAEKAKEAEKAKAKAAAEKNSETAVDAEDKDADEDSDMERPSSEDDWSSEEDNKGKTRKAKKEDVSEKNQPDADSDFPEDDAEQPDVLDVTLRDWDLALSPLDYAIISGSVGAVQALLNADPKLATKAKGHSAHIFHPLCLTILSSDDAHAEEIIDQLIRAGASSAQADERLFSVFHSLVLSGRTRLVEKILRSDPSANAALNVPLSQGKFIYPLVSAIGKGFYSVAALLLGYGAKVCVSPDDLQKVKNMMPNINCSWYHPSETPHELDYLKEVHLPVEIAFAHQNYMAELLIRLGAQVSVPIRAYFEHGKYQQNTRMSLLDCVVKQVEILEEELAKPQRSTEKSTGSPNLKFAENPKTSVELRRTIQGRLEQFKKERMNVDSSAASTSSKQIRAGDEQKKASSRRRALTFFQDMKGVLESVGAKTFTEIFVDFPDAPKSPAPPMPPKPASKYEAKQPYRTQYDFISHLTWHREVVLPHLLDQYDALFEACWTGDNVRIEELCLPRKASRSGKPPIRITVQTQYNSSEGIHTPLSLAILARKWDTARVVLAIAAAQYKPKEGTSNEQVTTQSFIIDAEADSDSDGDTICGPDDDSMDVDARGVGTIIDLATRDSAIQCNVSPQILVNCSVSGRVSRDGRALIPDGPVICQACFDGDLEAFVNIYDMAQELPGLQEPSMQCMLGALKNDSPELVDEIIRRTGLGIDLDQLVSSENDAQPVENLSKLYLGLTVHGKKRKDLARYVGGHCSDTNVKDIPLLWSAIRHNAKKVIDYLSGSGPLAAYRYYATTKSSERAESLRRFQDLDKQLPKLLGILQNSRGENALTAAIVSGAEKERLSLAKQILALFPAQKYLQSSLAFTGWTPLHLAAAQNLEPAFFDFLFSNGLSAEHTDKNGMNIYHIVCRLVHLDLLKYFLEKIPQDVSSRLLKQTSRRSGETPIMTAVLNGQRAVVDVLLQSGLEAVKECLTIRDAKGFMPLHAAVRSGFANIASSLIAAAPDSEATYCENGVGETPLETACAKWLINTIRGDFLPRCVSLRTMHYASAMTAPGPPSVHELTTEIDLLKSVQTNLLRDGKLTANTKFKDALDAFISYLVEKRDTEANMSSIPEEEELEELEELRDCYDHTETFEVVFAAVSAAPGQRRLVHLIDVQRSVQSSLEKAGRDPTFVAMHADSNVEIPFLHFFPFMRV